MEVRTYTNIWNVEKKLYRLEDLKLPFPIAFRQVGLALGFGLPWVLLMIISPIPLTGPYTAIIWFGPPVAIALLGNKPWFEGKSIIQYIRSVVGYLFRAHTYSSVEPRDKFIGTKHVVTASYWSSLRNKKRV